MLREIIFVIVFFAASNAIDRQVNVRAPASVLVGTSGTVACSVSADELDETLAVVVGLNDFATWNNTNNINLGRHVDDYGNGTMETVIEGSVDFDGDADTSVVIQCFSRKYDFHALVVTRVTNNASDPRNNETLEFNIKTPMALNSSSNGSAMCSVSANDFDNALGFVWANSMYLSWAVTNSKDYERQQNDLGGGRIQTKLQSVVSWDKAQKVLLQCYSTKKPVFSTLSTSIDGSSQKGYGNPNYTQPILHIRAPSSVNVGESSSISCSSLAGYEDNTLQLIWNNNATTYGLTDDGFDHNTIKHDNGTFETVISAFVRFDSYEDKIPLECFSMSSGLHVEKETIIYHNGTDNSTNNHTEAMLHIRAPSSISLGESSSISCSVTADDFDDTLELTWNNSTVMWGSSNDFQYQLYNYTNGSVETSIEGFGMFDMLDSPILLSCYSSRYDLYDSVATVVYNNSTLV